MSISINLKRIRENKPDVWEKHRMSLLFVPGINELNEIDSFEMSKLIGQEGFNNFFRDISDFSSPNLSQEITTMMAIGKLREQGKTAPEISAQLSVEQEKIESIIKQVEEEG